MYTFSVLSPHFFDPGFFGFVMVFFLPFFRGFDSKSEPTESRRSTSCSGSSLIQAQALVKLY